MLGDLVSRMSHPTSLVAAAVNAPFLWHTYTHNNLGEEAIRGTIGGFGGTYILLRCGLDWSAQQLLSEPIPQPPPRAYKIYTRYLVSKYGHTVAGLLGGHYFGKEWLSNLGEMVYMLAEGKVAPRLQQLFVMNGMNSITMYALHLLLGLAAATIVRATVLETKPRRIVEELKGKFLERWGRKQEAEQIYEQLEREGAWEEKSEFVIKRRRKEGEQGGLLLGLRNTMEALINATIPLAYDPLRSYVVLRKIRSAEKQEKKIPTLEQGLDVFYYRLAARHMPHAEEQLQRLGARYPTNYELQFLEAWFIEAKNEREQSEVISIKKRRALQAILRTGEQTAAFQQQGEHRNEVLFYKPEQSIFLAGTLVYKRNTDPRGLKVEEQNLRFLRSRLGNHVVRVLDQFQDQAFTYLALLYAGDTTLTDAAPRNGERQRTVYMEKLKQSLDLLVEIQYAMEKQTDTIALDPIGQREESYFTHRIRDVFFGQMKRQGVQVDPEAEKTVMQAHTPLNCELRELPRDQLAFYTDANPGNWFVDEQGRITRGDLESNRLLPQYFDLLLLFDFLGGILKEDERRALEMHYVQTRARRFETAVDLRAFDRTKRIAGYHKHLEQAGYKARDAELSRRAGKDPQEHYTVAHYHLERAGHYLDQMVAYQDVPQKHQGLLRDARFALASMVVGIH